MKKSINKFSGFAARISALALLVGFCCNCDVSVTPPKIDSPTAINVTATGATLGGTLVDDGGSVVVRRGVCFSRKIDNSLPAVGGERVTTVSDVDTDSGVFAIDVSDLVPETVYVVRAFARNRKGYIGHSAPLEFTTLAGSNPNGDKVGIDGSDINAIATQADGKILIGGRFDAVQGEERLNLARLNADGSLDADFAPYIEYPFYNATVRAIAVQDDGMIIVGGIFLEVDGHAVQNIARLYPDGTLDDTFNASVEYGIVDSIAIQDDGMIIVGGSFETYDFATMTTVGGLNGNSRYPYLGRLNANGSLDTTFNPGPATNKGPNNSVFSIAVQDDGKILISGGFHLYNGVAQARFARLESNGNLDTGFAPDFDAYSMALQADGMILIASYNPANVSPPNDPTYGLYRVETSGTLDPGYATSTGNTGGAFVNNAIYSIAVQSDGKAIIAGNFTEVDGTPRDGIARINPNGTLDNTFNVELEEIPYAIALSPEGKLLVGASTFAGVEPDAELFVQFENDPAVSMLSTTPTSVEWSRSGSAPVLSDVVFERSLDGGLNWTLLGDGAGSRFAGGWQKIGVNMTTPGLVRARGRTDTGGKNGSEGIIEEIEDYPVPGVSQLTLANPTATDFDGDYALLGGEIVNGGTSPITERGVVYSRTAENGNPIVGGAGVLKVIEGGNTVDEFSVDVFDLVAGANYSYRAYAINSRGVSYTDVATFATVGAPSVISPTAVMITDTSATLGGNIISSGGYDIVERGVYAVADQGQNEERIGDKDSDFLKFTDTTPIVGSGAGLFSLAATDLSPGTDYYFAAYAKNSEGTIYSEEGYFTTLGVSEPEPEESGQSPSNFSQSPSNFSSVEASAPAGQIDSSFEVGGGLGEIDGIVQAIAVLPGGLGDILVAGEFFNVGGETHRGIARLDDSGTVYPAFDTRVEGVVNSVGVGSDGSVVIGGIFTTVNGMTRNGIAKLDADGDNVSPTEFDPGAGADNIVYSVAVQEDGKILVGGLFGTVRGQVRSRIARLNANGSVDPSFNPGADDAVYSIALQPDGKILVAGNFTNIAGTAVNRIARLNADGTLDANFDPGSGANGRVAALSLQPDGKILLGGYFTQVNGFDYPRIARLEADGSLDQTFATGDGANDNVFTMALQTDGKILIGGLFTSFNGTNLNRIARLNANGSLDNTFDPGAGADGEVSALALQTDGSILIGGNFLNFDGVGAPYLLRYGNDVGVEDVTIIDGTQLRWTRSGGGPAIHPLGFGLSTDQGRTWTDLGEGVPIAGGRSITGQDLPPFGMVRVLGQTSGGFLGGSTGLLEEIAIYDHRGIITGLQAKLAAANANVAKVQKQIKAAKKKKDKAKLKKLNKSLKTATSQVATAKADLAKY